MWVLYIRQTDWHKKILHINIALMDMRCLFPHMNAEIWMPFHTYRRLSASDTFSRRTSSNMIMTVFALILIPHVFGCICNNSERLESLIQASRKKTRQSSDRNVIHTPTCSLWTGDVYKFRVAVHVWKGLYWPVLSDPVFRFWLTGCSSA